VQLHVYLKMRTLKFKLLYLRNRISFNKICSICCVNTHIQSLKVWLKSVLSWLKYSIFSRGLFFIGAPCTFGLTTAPIDPSIWEEPAIGALRVAPINPAVLGCERLAPTSSVIERQLIALSGTGFAEPSVTKDEGTGTPRPESPVSTSASTRERNSMALS